MRPVRLALAAVLAVGLTALPAHAATTFEDNQVPLEDHAENGALHITADDTLAEEVGDPPSLLFPSSQDYSSALISCSGAEDPKCGGSSDLSFIAHLPACDATVTTDCISSVTATAEGGSTSTGEMLRYFPDYGPQSFTGKSSILLPTGRAPSVWNIPGAPHAGGTQYAVVARLRGSTTKRAAASFFVSLTPVSLKSDAYTQPDYQLSRWTSPGRLAGSAGDRGKFRCAYWGESGSCLLSRDFPAGFSFTVNVRLAVEPAGWLHGRIDSPTVTFTKDGESTVVSVTARPVQVPAFQVARQHLDFPANIQTAFGVSGPYGAGGTRQDGGQYRTDLTQRNAGYSIVAYKNEGFEQLELLTPVIGDKAGYAPWIWRVRTLSETEMARAGTCLTSGSGVKGIVTTNATIYGSGPPAYNSNTSSLDYKVAAPHYTRTGDVFKGSYTLIVKSGVARCIYGFTDAPISATVEVLDTGAEKSAVVTNVSEKDGWLKLSATGFTHSAPTVRAVLTQQTTTAAAPAARTASYPRKRTVTGSTLARKVGLSVPKGARLTVTRSSRHSRVCSVRGTTLSTLSRGTCLVTVKVTVKGKTTSRTLTVTVT